MSDFQKKAELGKLARMQGIKLSRPEAINAPRRNRIEDALGGRTPVLGEQSYIPEIASRKVEEDRWSKTAAGGNAERNYKRFLGRFFLGFGILTMLGVVSFGGYVVFNNHKHPKALTADQTIQAVEKLVELPQGETPTVATISDLEPLKDQEFFNGAEIGDKVLIFEVAKKAVLYRPSGNKIIQIAPLN